MTAPAPVGRRPDSWSALQSAALDLVGRRGFDAVTVDDIAAAAGVSRRTFFNHFPTKAAALFDAPPGDAERLAGLLVKADPARDGLWGAIREVCVAYVAGSAAVLPVRRRLVAGRPDMDASQRIAYLHFGEALDRWLAEQLPGDAHAAHLLREGANAVMVGAFLAWQPDDDPGHFDELVARGFDLMATGLGAIGTTA